MVSVRLPSALVRELELIGGVEQGDRSATVRQLLTRGVHDWKLEHYARQYGDRKLTLARAAREAGVSLWEMMDYARSRKMAAQYELEDLQQDLKSLSGGVSTRGSN